MSDYVLSGGRTLLTPFNFVRLSPVFVPPDGIQAGFNGDYTGLTINFDVQAHPVWSDTRNRDPFAPNNGVTEDEDYFTVSHNLPSGRASASSLLAPPEPITAPALPPARYPSGSTLDLTQGIQR